MVIRLSVKDQGASPISGAAVQVSIAEFGSGSVVAIASAVTGSDGQAEAVWRTSAPNKRGGGGTPTGSYIATVTNVTASGYTWDDAQNSSAPFSVSPR